MTTSLVTLVVPTQTACCDELNAAPAGEVIPQSFIVNVCRSQMEPCVPVAWTVALLMTTVSLSVPL